MPCSCRNHPRKVSAGQAPSDETHENIYHSFEAGSINGVPISTSKDLTYKTNTSAEKKTSWTMQPETVDHTMCLESSLSTPRVDINRYMSSDLGGMTELKPANESSPEAVSSLEKLLPVKVRYSHEAGPSILRFFTRYLTEMMGMQA
ncbi:hypothetical protein MKW92_014688 [Papaver armeniacum]|nr:hypothetical protein MKW92_014688 [Papaver armeniacum]